MKIRMMMLAAILFAIGISMSCLGAPSEAASINWHPTNQATVSWDAVSTFSDGSALPADSTVQYAVYTRKDTDPITTFVLATTVSAPTAVITFTVEGRYFVGIKAQRYVSGALIPESDSNISWSDVAASTQGGVPFGIAYFKKLKDAGGLR